MAGLALGTFILAISLGLQVVAAVLAIRLIGTTRAVWAWVLIAGALVLMTGRRAITLVAVLSGNGHVNLSAEIIALAISVAMVAGVGLIRPVFERMRRTAAALADREAALQRELAERRALEGQLVNAQKMEAIGRISGGIAHDFNNMLTIIMASSELARFPLAPEDPTRLHLQMILDAAGRAARLTNQLLLFARKQPVERTVFDVADQISNMSAMLRSLLGDRGTILLECSGPAWVEADRGQLEQVVLNLAMNAKDAMPQAGTIRIGVQAGTAQRGTTSEHLIWISDTGVGMNAQTMARIFEPFFTTKPPGQGTGLGLATAYGIVGRAGGRIEVESTEKVGTTFRIYLPAVMPAAHAASVNTAGVSSAGGNENKSSGGRESILLVEDEPELRTIVAAVLRERGYTVTEADNGLTALELLPALEVAPDLLLTDLVMPGMDGRLLARELRRGLPLLPILFMTGYTTETAADSARTDAATTDSATIHKPFSVDVLCREIRVLLDHAGGSRARGRPDLY